MRKILTVFLVLVGLAVIVLSALLTYVFALLPNVPLEEVKVEYSHEQIKRGEYLSKHVAVCITCHSERDWTRFAGPARPGTEGQGGELFNQAKGYPGNYPASNITGYHLKDWSDAELLRAITSGVSRNGEPLFPIMPYPNYGKMDRNDLNAIVAYVRSLPAIENDVPTGTSDFPMNIFIRLIPSESTFEKRPDREDRVAYGRYLATAASCAECHTPAERGQIIEEKLYSGGRFLKFEYGSVESSNITPHKTTGIGAWSEEDFVERFKAFDREKGYTEDKVAMGQFNTPMPWQAYAGMTENDLTAIYAYLMSLEPIENKVVRKQ